MQLCDGILPVLASASCFSHKLGCSVVQVSLQCALLLVWTAWKHVCMHAAGSWCVAVACEQVGHHREALGSMQAVTAVSLSPVCTVRGSRRRLCVQAKGVSQLLCVVLIRLQNVATHCCHCVPAVCCTACKACRVLCATCLAAGRTPRTLHGRWSPAAASCLHNQRRALITALSCGICKDAPVILPASGRPFARHVLLECRPGVALGVLCAVVAPLPRRPPPQVYHVTDPG